VSLSPIATLTLLAGSEALLFLRADAPAYDPSSPTDQRAPVSTELPVRGVFSTITRAGIEVKHEALFLVPGQAEPAGIVPDVSRCLVNGVHYIIRQCDPRWYIGEFDGYNLHLGQ
jgi:hypothetical protein